MDERRAWLRLLALSETARLERIWESLPATPEMSVVRRPEIGLAMVRGRAGGTGAAFNLGEMTVTRCVVSAADTVTGSRIDGVGAVAGRDRDKADLVARLDAAFQDSGCDAAQRRNALDALAEEHRDRKARQAGKTAATRVEFFTMERGHS